MCKAELSSTRVGVNLAWRRFKRALEAIAYGTFDRLVLLGARKIGHSGHVAVVHVQLLGDMILWLPYGQALVRHLQGLGYRVSLIVEASLAPLANRVFSGVELLAIDKGAFLHQPRQRTRCLRRLRRLGVAQTLNPSYPRDAIFMDAVVHALGAPAVGFDAVFMDRPWFDRVLSKRLYQRLLPPIANVHQQVRQRAFVQALGVAAMTIRPAEIPVACSAPVSGPYWLLAPGASRAFRRWPPERCVEVARHVAGLMPEWRCVLVGTTRERPITERIAKLLGDRAIDLAGQTDLPRLLDLVAHARLVLGNDSAAGHLAAALGTPVVVIVGGGHWGLCLPYDSIEAPVRRLPVAVGVSMSCFGCDWRCRYATREDTPFPCIDAVSVEAVIAAVDTSLSTRGAGACASV